jgi:two-component system cell cycle response regulator
MARNKTVVTVISKITDRPVERDAALVVIHGMELGRKFDINRDEMSIGRSSRADVQVDHESVSRNHARLLCAGRSVLISDLGSTNGTFVNDELVVGERALRNGDLLKIGRTIFKFIAGDNIEASYHDEVYRLTTVDGLTQAFNRRYFQDALEREISRCIRYGRDLSLMLLDIDHFKRINDTFGHLAGDDVLKHLSTLVRGRIRKEDIFARYGGEEFALLLPELAGSGAYQLGEKLRRLVEAHPFTFDNQRLPVTVSVGLATLSGSQQDSATLVRTADACLYEAKSQGRNRVCAPPGP